MPFILIVEDLPAVREMLCRFLSDEGYQVLAAEHGRKALDLLRQGPRPDVILSDLHMPQMDGAALCRALAEDPALCQVPVLLMSAEAELPGIAASLGVKPLHKPVDLRRLRGLVEQAVPGAATPAVPQGADRDVLEQGE